MYIETQRVPVNCISPIVNDLMDRVYHVNSDTQGSKFGLRFNGFCFYDGDSPNAKEIASASNKKLITSGQAHKVEVAIPAYLAVILLSNPDENVFNYQLR